MMKRTVCGLLFLFALLLVLGCAAAEGQTTMLVYMCGADIQSDACEDIIEMASVEAGDAINMVVLAGGAREWDLEDLKGNSRTLAVIRDGYFEELKDWGYGSMGETKSLKQFLEYGLSAYPADRTIVILWNHGAGSEGGICFDETDGDDSLTVVEINQVLADLQKTVPGYHINIFGSDACMMGTYEMAAMLSHHNIDYYVASEELEPGTGWYYTGFLNALKEDPSIPDETLCGSIIDTFMQKGLENTPDDYLTLSAVKLSEVGALKESMEQFASVMSGTLVDGNLSAVRRGRSRMYTFGSFADGSWDMVDLGAVLDAYAQFDSATAAEARRCLSNAVVLSSQTNNLDKCCGLSILLPQDTAETFDTYKEGFNLSGIIPNWVDFVNDYVSKLVGGSYSCSVTGTCQFDSDYDFSEDTFMPSSWFDGCLFWNDEEESYGEYEMAEYELEDAQGFTVQLSQEDLANLDYVEGMLMMNISDDDSIAYVDFGLMQNNLIDWQTGTVVSLYDGTWPVFGGQPVPLYDQTNNENSRRSLIPVKLNGEHTYLVVVFPAGSAEGRILGANAGYDENGLPIRNTTPLKPGDRIVPVYTLYYEEEGKEDLQESEFDGPEIIWEDGMTVSYQDLYDETDPTKMMFCFVINDIFGENSLSDIIEFEL